MLAELALSTVTALALSTSAPTGAWEELSYAAEGKAPFSAVFDTPGDRRRGFGLLPAENNGSLGPAMRADDASVLARGRTAVVVQADAANYLTDVGGSDTYLYQKFERQTLSVEVRRGLKSAVFPALEAGVRLDVRRRDPGVLNGFIAGWEKGMAAVTRDDQFVNDDRVGEWALTQPGEEIVSDGRVLRAGGDSTKPSLGDLTFTLKAALTRGDPARFVPQVAARLTACLTRPGADDGNGDFLGAGVSIAQPVSRRLTAHADLRALKTVAALDPLGLPLKPWAAGGSAGLEWRLLKNTSVGVQANYDTSASGAAGLLADEPRSDLTVGLSHLARLGAERLLVQLYAREDVRVSEGDVSLYPYSPPDLQAGVKLTWIPAIRRARTGRAR